MGRGGVGEGVRGGRGEGVREGFGVLVGVFMGVLVGDGVLVGMGVLVGAGVLVGVSVAGISAKMARVGNGFGCVVHPANQKRDISQINLRIERYGIIFIRPVLF